VYLAGTVGAGNSIANLGLAGGLIAAFSRHRAWRIDAALSTFFVGVIALTALPTDESRLVGLVVAVLVGQYLVVRREKFPRWVFPADRGRRRRRAHRRGEPARPAILAGLALGAAITGGVVVGPEPLAPRAALVHSGRQQALADLAGGPAAARDRARSGTAPGCR
jgi:hypothetical protein